MLIGFGASTDENLRCAYRAYTDWYDAARSRAADKLKLLREYDVSRMKRAAAICHWGRSGSLLLASYLDGHPHVVMLPHGNSENIYSLFQENPSLSV
jgi:hypothetical protein